MIGLPPRVIEFDVPGDPVTQGSVKIWHNPNTGKPEVVHDQRDLALWRKCIQFEARRAVRIRPHFAANEPLIMGVVFRLLPPGPGRPGSKSATAHPTTKHDHDKLLRAVRDALTGTLYVDDGQVLGPAFELPDGRVIGFADYKRHVRPGELPGCLVRCARLADVLADAQATAIAGPQQRGLTLVQRQATGMHPGPQAHESRPALATSPMHANESATQAATLGEAAGPETVTERNR